MPELTCNLIPSENGNRLLEIRSAPPLNQLEQLWHSEIRKDGIFDLPPIPVPLCGSIDFWRDADTGWVKNGDQTKP
jgi:hypothetical protein